MPAFAGVCSTYKECRHVSQAERDVRSPHDSQKHGFWGDVWRVVRSYLRTEWPDAVLVAALVTIFHLQTNWLAAIDGYAFLAIANLGVVKSLENPKQTPKRLIVAGIDDKAFQTRYRGRSPLSRCELLNDLKPIYGAKPDLIAIDIDISPADWSDQPPAPSVLHGENRLAKKDGTALPLEVQCELQLYEMIVKSTDTKTVLMEPFAGVGQAGIISKQKSAWDELGNIRKHQHIRFARAEVPVNYGLVIKQLNGDKDFAVQIAAALGSREQNNSRKPTLVDPRRYVEIIPVSVSELNKSAAGLELPLAETKRAGGAKHPYSVVFFGGIYGKDDLYLTPLGEVFGVEIQAATYLSQDGLRERHLEAFVCDIVIAILFGILIAMCWYYYFAWRIDKEAVCRQLAPFWILVLVASGGVLALIAVGFSTILVTRWGVWISPVPVAIGMLIDIFVSGSVAQAVHALRHNEPLVPSIGLQLMTAGSGTAKIAQDATLQQRTEPGSFCESLNRMCGGDVQRLRKNGRVCAAGLLTLWTIAWMVIVALALYFAIKGH